jgi:putative tryptophan/tyrosine transport system substrate-binding protein
MTRRHVLLALVALLVAIPIGEVHAQSSGNGPIIGLLDAGERSEWWAAFRQKLRDLGYIEGRNVRFELRSAKAALERLGPMAQELVNLKPAVIVTSGTTAALAARRATTKIPIVMATGADQVSLGLVASLAHPGGNVTGLATLTSDLQTKRFDLLREIVPKASRLAVLWHTDNTPSMVSVRDLEHAAERSRIALQSFGVRSTEEISDAFATMTRQHADALLVVHSPLPFEERARIAELALKYRIPAIYGAAEYVEAGGLISLAPVYPDLFRRAAVYVDKILKGANPGDLPIEQPTKFETVINLKTAQALGLTLPRPVLLRAGHVIQ